MNEERKKCCRNRFRERNGRRNLLKKVLSMLLAVSMITLMFSESVSANGPGDDKHTDGLPYVMGYSIQNDSHRAFEYYIPDGTQKGKLYDSGYYYSISADNGTSVNANAVCIDDLLNRGKDGYEYDVPEGISRGFGSAALDEVSDRVVYYAVHNLGYVEAHRLICYYLQERKGRSGTNRITGLDSVLSSAEAAVIPEDVIFTAYYLFVEKTAGETGGAYQNFLTWSEKKIEKKDYYIALQKSDDAGDLMNDVSFDIEVNDGESKIVQKAGVTAEGKNGVWTGWDMDLTTGQYTDCRSGEGSHSGIALVYLGKYQNKPSVTVQENWKVQLEKTSPDPRDYQTTSPNPYTYKPGEILTTREEALHAAAVISDESNLTWVNKRNGELSLSKESGDTKEEFTQWADRDGNRKPNVNYSLEGAVYGVFATEKDAKNPDNDSLILAEFTTDKNGKGIVTKVTGELYGEGTDTLKGLPQRTYYVRELKSSEAGYFLDSGVYRVVIDADQRAVDLHVTETYQYSDARKLVLEKKTAPGNPDKKDLSLAGALFKVSYWPYSIAAEYTEEQFESWAGWGEKPLRVWVLETKDAGNGSYTALLDDDHKVKGDDFFRNEKGELILPFGWITVEEIKAPEGFLLEGASYAVGEEFKEGTKILLKTTEDGELKVENHLLGTGENLTAYDHPIRHPKIFTELNDADTGLHTAFPGKTTTLRDKVHYEDLIPGTTYVMEGELHDVEIKDVLTDRENQKITGKVMFTADEDGEGDVFMEFSFDASDLSGKKVVAFEYCYLEEGHHLVALHEDPEDAGQTVEFPEVKTIASATSSENGEVRVTDILTYSGFLPGYTYVVKGSLVDQAGQMVLSEGKPVTAEIEFSPEGSSGEIEMAFPGFVPEGYPKEAIEKAKQGIIEEAGKESAVERSGKFFFSYVVFEEVYIILEGDTGLEEHLMGEHKDLNDALQTVAGEIRWELPENPPELETETERTTEDTPPEPTPETPEPPGPPEQPKTGDDTPVILVTILAVLSAAGMIFVIRRKRKMTD